jgi:hypothetical protein
MEQRKIRLFGILKVTTDTDDYDENRAVKTLLKIKEVRKRFIYSFMRLFYLPDCFQLNLSIDELKSSGIGKYIAGLKSHPGKEIVKTANQLMNEWKAMAVSRFFPSFFSTVNGIHLYFFVGK